MRRIALALVTVPLAVAIALAAPASYANAAAGGSAFHVSDAFDVYADAYPVEPVFGLNSIGIPPRPTSTRAHVFNAPVSAYARAAAFDLGVAESYTGKQGPDAEIDTADSSAPTDRSYDNDGLALHAHAERAPRADAHATGNGSGSPALQMGSSNAVSTADGTAERIVAHTAATVNDVTIGVFHMGSARFDATASVTGRRGGAAASGAIVTNDATMGGIPVVVATDGLQIDQTRIPANQVSTAADALRQQLTHSPYIEVRTVQPKVEVATSGLSASVSGGGVFVRMATGDPKNNYFMTFTMLGGSARAALGGPVSSGLTGPGDGAPFTTGGVLDGPPPTGPVLGSVLGPGRADFGAGAVTPVPAVPAFVMAHGGGRYRLPGPWTGWPWLLAVTIVALAGWQVLGIGPLAPLRRRIERFATSFADRYVRG